MLGRILFRILLEQERHHVRLLRVIAADRVERGVGEHLDAELVIDQIDGVELLALGAVLLHAEQRADRRAERHDVAALDPDLAGFLGVVDRRIADRIGAGDIIGLERGKLLVVV